MDWVVQGETYGLDVGPYRAAGMSANDEGDIFILPLTSHDDINSRVASRIPQLEQTAIRVVGTLNYATYGFSSSTNGAFNTKFHARIVVTTQQIFTPTPVQETALQYDMRLPETANDDFLWEYMRQFNFVAGFWDDNVGQPWQATQSVDVDVRVSRRLHQREVLALIVQIYSCEGISTGGAQVFTANADVGIWFEPRFRTLVKTLT